MTTEKKSFVVYCDYYETLNTMKDSDLGKLFRAMLIYANTREAPKLGGVVGNAFGFIKAHLDRDYEKYIAKSERNRENGKKSAEAKKARKEAELLAALGEYVSSKHEAVAAIKETSEKAAEEIKETVNEDIVDDNIGSASSTNTNTNSTKSTNVEFVNLNSTNSTDNDNVNVSVSVNDNGSGNDSVSDNVNDNVNVSGNDACKPVYEVRPSDIPDITEPVTLPLSKGDGYTVTKEDIEKYRAEFPLVPVCNELKVIKLWLEEKKSRLRSKHEMPRLIHKWFEERSSRIKRITESNEYKSLSRKNSDASKNKLLENLAAYIQEHPEEKGWFDGD